MCSCILSVLKHSEDLHFKIPYVRTHESLELWPIILRARRGVSRIFVFLGLNIKDTSRVSRVPSRVCLIVSYESTSDDGIPADAEHTLYYLLSLMLQVCQACTFPKS